MPEDNEHIKQEAIGHGNIQAAGKNINISQEIFNIPTEKFLLAELMASLAIQWGIYLLTLMWLPFGNCIVCFPFLFIPNAIITFFMGKQLGDKKIIKLSLFSGITTIIPWVLLLIYYFIYSLFEILQILR